MRYGLFESASSRNSIDDDKKLFFTLSRTTIKQYGLPLPSSPSPQWDDEIDAPKSISTSIALDHSAVDELATYEKKVLKSQMEIYLSKRECSPRKLTEWLQARKLPHPWREEFISSAIENKFLSEERYLRSACDKAKIQGKSKFLLKRELIYQQVSLHNEIEEELVNYDDQQVVNKLLENYLKRRKLNLLIISKADLEKLINYARRRGFTYPLIVDVIEKLKRQVSSSVRKSIG